MRVQNLTNNSGRPASKSTEPESSPNTGAYSENERMQNAENGKENQLEGKYRTVNEDAIKSWQKFQMTKNKREHQRMLQ